MEDGIGPLPYGREFRGKLAVELVTSRPSGKERLYRLRPEGLREVHAWTERFTELWNERLARLAEAGGGFEDIHALLAKQPQAVEGRGHPDIALAVLEQLVPRYIATRLFQAVLESKASEESSRMIAMKNATENAEDLIDDLTLTYNKIRQANITREMIEIASGANAR